MQRDYEYERGQRRYGEEREGRWRGYPEEHEYGGHSYGPERGRSEREPQYSGSPEGGRGYDSSGFESEGRRAGQWDDRQQGYRRAGYSQQGTGRYDERAYDRPDFEQSPYRQQRSGRQGDQERYQPVEWSYTEVWLIPGPHSGRGPQGYRRSDERIREDVCDRLTQHGHLDASQIRVQVHQGEVTLQGTVDSRQAKRMAEDTAESVAGVHDIQNQLRVQQPGSQGPAGRFGPFGSSPVQRAQIRQGMDVVGSDASRIGQVKEVREQDFLVDRAGQRDLYVPFHAVHDVMGNQLILTVPAGQVEQQGWASPSMMPTGSEQPSRQPAAAPR
jgi:osmotically-inducible protein OsmY